MSKEEADVSSYRAIIASKLQELEEIILDVEDVSALQTIDFNLGKLHEGTKDGSKKNDDDKVVGGQAKKRVAVEELPRSRKPWSGSHHSFVGSPGVAVSGDARVGEAEILEDEYTYPTTYLTNISTSLQVACDGGVGRV